MPYRATESPRSAGTRAHLELAIIKSRYGSLEVIVLSSFNDLSILQCEKEAS